MKPQPDALPASLWAATAVPRPSYEHFTNDGSVDVAVIGAGFTGLSTALHLARAGRSVAVLEAYEPGWGASGRNGGQIIAGLKHNPDQLEAELGATLGTGMAREYGAGGDLVFSLIDRYSIHCEDRRSGWIQGAHGPKAMREFVKPRCDQWKARGVDARLLDQEEISRLVGSSRSAYCGGWFDPRGGVLQPLSYARGLAAAAQSEGATIYADAAVRRLRQDNGKWELVLDEGSLRAQKVVLATNAYTDDLWPGLRRTVIPVTSFQIATRPLPASIRETILPGGQGVADTRRLLLYFRLDHDGRLLMGGRSPVDDNPRMEDAASLRSAIARIFPQAAGEETEFVWSGRVAITKDGLPHAHILAPGLYAALGFNGRGVAACTVTGKLMAQLVNGAEPGELPLLVATPDPFVFHSLRKLGVFAASQYYRVLDRLEAR
ncbi:MAG TPA: FAD-binding oxidoreductase [Rhizobiaceae bacterium]|nr:FAD-binding oxidoreductase [Rhizobiaceae bacterium]